MANVSSDVFSKLGQWTRLCVYSAFVNVTVCGTRKYVSKYVTKYVRT